MSPMGVKHTPVSLAETFWSRVDRTSTPDGCWEWTGSRNAAGYGKLSRKYAHRLAWELTHGMEPPESIDHLCRNTSCVRPDHLECVPIAENIRRGFSASAVNARKTHCIYGHEFTPENTYIDPDGNRSCRTCARRVDMQRFRSKRERNRARLLAGLANPPHGTNSTYTNWLCRCDACKEASNAARLARKKRRREAPVRSANCPGVAPPFDDITIHDDDCCERWRAENLCGVRRGGARSDITCELPRDHEDSHVGRSPAGRYFTWAAPPGTGPNTGPRGENSDG